LPCGHSKKSATHKNPVFLAWSQSELWEINLCSVSYISIYLQKSAPVLNR
jgi:hypothetical protein